MIIDNVDEATTYSKVLIGADKQTAYNICKEKCQSLEDFLNFYNNVVSNAMKNIGFLWESGDVSVAKEHISSNTLNEVMAKIVDEYPNQKANDIHVFLSSAPHEDHGQGINIASKVFEKLGYKVTNLGTNIPVKDIKKAIMEFKPDLVILAATLQTSLVDIALLILS